MLTQENRSGVITTAARILAVDGTPITETGDPVNYEYFVPDMRSDPARNDGDENFNSSNASIGRSREFSREFNQGRRLFLSIAILNEAAGLMKPFNQGNSGEKEIGIIEICGEATHYHRKRREKVGQKVLGTYMNFTAHILDSDKLFLGCFDIGNNCSIHSADMSAEIRLAETIGMSEFLTESGIRNNHPAKRFRVEPRELGNDETNAVMNYLINSFASRQE